MSHLRVQAEEAIHYYERTFSPKNRPYVSDKFLDTTFGGIVGLLLDSIRGDYRSIQMMGMGASLEESKVEKFVRENQQRIEEKTKLIHKLNSYRRIKLPQSHLMVEAVISEEWLEAQQVYRREVAYREGLAASKRFWEEKARLDEILARQKQREAEVISNHAS